MREKRDCGPAGLAWALFRAGCFPSWEEAYAYCLAHWPGGWHSADSLKDDVNDWADDHRLVIESLGLHQTMVTFDDIMTGKYRAGTVVVLLHLHGAFAKHWVVWEETTVDRIRLHWGNGHVAEFAHDQFEERFLASQQYFRLSGKCAYTPTVVPPRLSWWQRFRRRVLGWFARRS